MGYDTDRFRHYRLDDYLRDIDLYGLGSTWEKIGEYLLDHGESAPLLTVNRFGELYEIGLAARDKERKKKRGQYYTPDDVARVMSHWLDSVDGENLCDVGCGTGNLILAYLDFIGTKRARTLLEERRVFLYDQDRTALLIAKTALQLKYGTDLEDNIRLVAGDFLNRDIHLPENAKTISNPPYAAIPRLDENWEITEVIRTARDFYAAFMEKIVQQSRSSVIISPFSFISGTKFYPLRKVLNNFQGEIYAFDNVPGTIFRGRKYGVFNTNTSNSVRAAITVVRRERPRGFCVTPLIRFKSSERKRLIDARTLEEFLLPIRQTITPDRPVFYKCFKELAPLLERLEEKARNHTLQELITPSGSYALTIPTTCRYYTVASAQKMKRRGQVTLRFSSEESFYYAYCLFNSSFAYWHWRLYDGGITYPKRLMTRIPSLFHLLTEKDHAFFKEIAAEMIGKEREYRITKKNVGIQENIQYPREYRDRINQRILEILRLPIDASLFDPVHSHTALEVRV